MNTSPSLYKLVFSAFFVFVAVCLCSCNTGVTPPEKPAEQRRFVLSSGDTLSGSMKKEGVPDAARSGMVGGLSKVFDPRRCKPGDSYEVDYDTASGAWRSFRYYTTSLEYYHVERSTAAVVTAIKKVRQVRKAVRSASGILGTSLWESMSAQKLKPDLIVSFADIFAWQIDFLTEPRAGDRYKLLWEEYTADDGSVHNGEIIAAQYTASGRTHTAMLFTEADGGNYYFTPEGESMHRAFLKAPLQYRRISSFFTLRRFHPILKYFRPHLGIDYAAPRGTPVSSVANGVVTYAGYHGGFGNYVEIRHPNNYATAYGHLAGFARGTRVGARVQQGQVIGYVGATGLATGPHLDFRIKKDGHFFNYLTLKSPPAQRIPDKEKTRFAVRKKDLFTQLALVR